MAIFGNASPCGIALALVALPVIAGAHGRSPASFGVAAYLAVSLLALALLYRAPPPAAPAIPGQSRRPDPRVFSAVVTAGLIYGLYNVSLVTIIGFGPLMLAERGWTIADASSTTSVVFWLLAFSLPAGGWLADRTGRNATILLGGLAGYAVMLLLAPRVDAVLPAFVLLGILSGLPCGPIMSLPARVLAPETRSVGMGSFFAVYYAVNLAGPWLVGHLVEAAGDARLALDLGALFLGLCGLLWIVFRQLTAGSIAEPGPVATR